MPRCRRNACPSAAGISAQVAPENADTTTNTTDDDAKLIAVQVRLDETDHAKLTDIAERLGCHKATVLRFLLRECTRLELQVARRREDA